MDKRCALGCLLMVAVTTSALMTLRLKPERSLTWRPSQLHRMDVGESGNRGEEHACPHGLYLPGSGSTVRTRQLWQFERMWPTERDGATVDAEADPVSAACATAVMADPTVSGWWRSAPGCDPGAVRVVTPRAWSLGCQRRPLAAVFGAASLLRRHGEAGVAMAPALAAWVQGCVMAVVGQSQAEMRSMYRGDKALFQSWPEAWGEGDGLPRPRTSPQPLGSPDGQLHMYFASPPTGVDAGSVEWPASWAQGWWRSALLPRHAFYNRQLALRDAAAIVIDLPTGAVDNLVVLDGMLHAAQDAGVPHLIACANQHGPVGGDEAAPIATTTTCNTTAVFHAVVQGGYAVTLLQPRAEGNGGEGAWPVWWETPLSLDEWMALWRDPPPPWHAQRCSHIIHLEATGAKGAPPRRSEVDGGGDGGAYTMAHRRGGHRLRDLMT